jgi:hypothetical protein
MGTMASTPFRVFATLALSLVLGLARAQDSYDDGPEVDPPERAARLALIRGEVSMQPAGEEDWAPALLNRPMTTGDKIWTENGARAEIQVGQAAIRLDGNTGFSFLNLDDNTVQMRMTAGTMIVDVRGLTGREQIEIATPNVALTLLRRGSYRVEVNDAGDLTTLRIGDGEAQATGGSQDVIVHSRQVATFRGYDDVVADWSSLGPPDEFDNWSMERERRLDRLASSKSSQYVSRDVTGYDELDEHGSWSSEVEYGYVWTPRVAVGWSPYSFGRWVWVSPWGWTWIDDSPWGYAPFHYGRWAHIRNRWCWVPGPRHVRAVYAPALVGWGGWSGGYVSWYPLGPGDVYRPGRRHSRHYWERVNFANAVIDRARLAQAYDRRGSNDGNHSNWHPRNRGVPGAVTAVPRESFAGSQRTRDRRVRVDQREWSRGNDNPAAPNIAPVRDSRFGGAARVHPRMAPALADRQVVTRREAPPAAARYTRRSPQVDNAQSPTSVYRQPDRGRERPEEPRIGDLRDRRNRTDERAGNDTPRNDRPAREARETDPAARTSVRDSRGIADLVREDRERQVREAREHNPEQQQSPQQAPDPQTYGPRDRADRPSQAWRQRQAEQQPREQREQSQQRESNEQENSLRAREYFQRQRDSERQRREVEQPRVEQPRQEQPRYERREQPRVEQPRQEQPRYEAPRQQPRQEQPRYEAPRENRNSSPPPQPQQQDRGPRDRGRDDFKSKRN